MTSPSFPPYLFFNLLFKPLFNHLLYFLFPQLLRHFLALLPLLLYYPYFCLLNDIYAYTNMNAIYDRDCDKVGFRVEHPQELINKIQFGEFGELCERGKGKVKIHFIVTVTTFIHSVTFTPFTRFTHLCN